MKKGRKSLVSIGIIITALIAFLSAGFASSTVPAKKAVPNTPPWLLHLPGIGGERSCDHTLILGLKEGGIKADFEIYDWTQGDIGLTALQDQKHHMDEAEKVAEILTKHFRADPKTPIYFTGHSAGAGIEAFALERLPDDVKVEVACMFAPALSPDYDLSKALKHVNKKLYVFVSPYDSVVLGTGTKLFGTVDGVKSEAAGLKGFVQPQTADAEQYKKICSQMYELSWGLRYGNVGSHISCMRTKFARDYVAVLLLTGLPPAPMSLVATTQPAAGPTTRPVAKPVVKTAQR